MVRRQQGITLMSFVIVLVVVGFFALMVMKLFPMYSEYNNLKSVMKAFAAQPNSASMTPAQAFSDLERRFNIAYIESVKREHVKITRMEGGWKMDVNYEVRKPIIANLDVVGKFNTTENLVHGGPAD